MKQAVLVVDMLNDFVTGALKCDRGLAIVPQTAKLLDGARKAGVPVIFCNDAHLKDIDHELKLWGDHAIAGTKGAEGRQVPAEALASLPQSPAGDSSSVDAEPKGRE